MLSEIFSNKNAIKVYLFLKEGKGMPKIPAIDDFRFGKTVNENKTLGTTGLDTGKISSCVCPAPRI